MTQLIINEQKMREYAAWLSLPKAERVPKSKTGWATEHDCDRSELYEWEKNDKFLGMVKDIHRGYFAPADITKIFEAVKKKALEGNVPAAKFVMEVSGILDQDNGSPLDNMDLEGKSVAELEKLLSSLDDG